jgi:quercetin dioxygenase-like cupin family protein
MEMEGFFGVVGGTRHSQAMTMVLGPGHSTGSPDNRHPESDQWLYVVSGRGTAVVEGEEVGLGEGSLLPIEAGEAHEISASPDEPLRTLNFYSSPVY